MATMQGGRITVDGGYTFLWIAMGDGEISGHVETDEGSIVKGSYGFWRTTRPQYAADLANTMYGKHSAHSLPRDERQKITPAK